MKKCGFTLAETLITLVIVGVVAALTVPNMIIKHQKEETLTRLKRVYSTIAQTSNKAIADYGPIKTWEPTNLTFANQYLIPYLVVSKDCGFDTSIDTCKYKFKFMNQSTANELDSGYYRFYLNDGTFVAVTYSSSPTRKYANVYVDINGQRKPNKMGRDVFEYRYELNYGRFFPTDYYTVNRETILTSPYGCHTNGKGEYCSTLIMMDGWQIKDDYPW